MRETMAACTALGSGVDLVEHAVDAHAHGRDVAPRLDVDVARALVERVVEEVLDRGDEWLSLASISSTRLSLTNRSRLPMSTPVVDLLLGGGDRAAEAVEVGDEPLDVARASRRRAAGSAGRAFMQVVDEPVVERVGDGDGDVALVGGDDERRRACARRGARGAAGRAWRRS